MCSRRVIWFQACCSVLGVLFSFRRVIRFQACCSVHTHQHKCWAQICRSVALAPMECVLGGFYVQYSEHPGPPLPFLSFKLPLSLTPDKLIHTCSVPYPSALKVDAWMDGRDSSLSAPSCQSHLLHPNSLPAWRCRASAESNSESVWAGVYFYTPWLSRMLKNMSWSTVSGSGE